MIKLGSEVKISVDVPAESESKICEQHSYFRMGANPKISDTLILGLIPVDDGADKRVEEYFADFPMKTMIVFKNPRIDSKK